MPPLAADDPAVPPSQSLPSGSRLEEFVIERVLGSGGFGITYLAKDSRLGRKVVIKENLPAQFCWRDTHSLTVRPRHTEGEDAGNFQYSLESFEREAATLASLDHPGIVKVLRSFEAHGTAYFVMPFVEGDTFDELIEKRRKSGQAFTDDELRGLTSRVLDALGYLHDRGIYHRDIKPGNILVTAAGEPVLIDFGAARQRLSERSLTVIESSGYTPFEQLQSRGKIGPWSDLYALGATLYKAITGETAAKAADRIMDDPQIPLAHQSALRGRHAPSLLASIDKAMSPKASDRFQNAAEWLVQIQPPPAMPSPPPAVARNPASQKPSAVVQTTAPSGTSSAPSGTSGAVGWYYKKTPHQAFKHGPFPQKELVARISAGLLNSEAFVLNQDEPASTRKWRKVWDVPQLRIALKSSDKVSPKKATLDARLQHAGTHPTRPDTRWYYKTGPRASVIGPFPHRNFIARIVAGLVKPEHLVSDEEEPKTWKQVHTVPELAVAL
jgi:serine/threonine protein kinase